MLLETLARAAISLMVTVLRDMNVRWCAADDVKRMLASSKIDFENESILTDVADRKNRRKSIQVSDEAGGELERDRSVSR